ncbi:MAG: DUF2062 domain-containing protein [Syntrophales bacterium]
MPRRIRTFYERFISLKGDPASLAAALAIGVFVGVTPTIPFHTAIVLIIGLLFRVNLTAAYLGSWLISNPVTIPLLYLSQYELGRILLGMDAYRFELPEYSLSAIAALGWRILLPLLVGGIVMAPLIAVPAYFIARRTITAIRARGCP